MEPWPPVQNHLTPGKLGRAISDVGVLKFIPTLYREDFDDFEDFIARIFQLMELAYITLENVDTLEDYIYCLNYLVWKMKLKSVSATWGSVFFALKDREQDLIDGILKWEGDIDHRKLYVDVIGPDTAILYFGAKSADDPEEPEVAVPFVILRTERGNIATAIASIESHSRSEEEEEGAESLKVVLGPPQKLHPWFGAVGFHRMREKMKDAEAYDETDEAEEQEVRRSAPDDVTRDVRSQDPPSLVGTRVRDDLLAQRASERAPQAKRRREEAESNRHLSRLQERFEFLSLPKEVSHSSKRGRPEGTWPASVQFPQLFRSPEDARWFHEETPFGLVMRTQNVARRILAASDDAEDLEKVNEKLLNTFIDAGLAALLIVQALMKTRGEGTGSSFQINANELREVLGYKIGSGGLSFILVWVVYWAWLFVAHNPEEEEPFLDLLTLTFDIEARDWLDQVTFRTRHQERMPGIFLKTNRESDVIDFLRRIFAGIHVHIQKALGATEEYYYHVKGNDPLADLLQSVTFFVSGTDAGIRPANGRGAYQKGQTIVVRTPFNHTVSSANGSAFWEYLFLSGRESYYEADSKHVVIMPGCRPACLNRALLCTCEPSSVYPSICTCISLEKDAELHPININDLVMHPENYYQYNCIIIDIKIYPKTQRKSKDFKVLLCSPYYYTYPNARVIMINDPQWQQGSAHCCVFKPDKPPEHLESELDEFKRYSFFNSFLHRLCHVKENVCPICGLLYPMGEEKAHLKQHRQIPTCQECGISFDTQEELATHSRFHCKHPGAGCCIEFSDEACKYKDKGENEATVVYADLESAIHEDGTHECILCGYSVAGYAVNIVNSIAIFLNNLVTWAKNLHIEEYIIYFHNGEGYDFHFVLLEIGKLAPTLVKSFDAVADSGEKLRFFSLTYKGVKMNFRDTYAFVPESLDNWIKSTQGSTSDFPIFNSSFREVAQRDAVLRKPPFPYKAITSPEVIKNPIASMDDWFTAPDRLELFCNRFTEEQLQVEYVWFKQAEEIFKWETVEDYYRTYLTCDVSLLGDCMNHFAKEVQSEFGLDVHRYYGTPSLTWAAWLKQLKYPIDPVPEKMYDVINSSIRGGQTGAMTRLFDKETRSEDRGCFCCDLDCNSLYATVMLNFAFPCEDWRLNVCPSNEITAEELLDQIKRLHSQGRSGFIECDLTVSTDKRFHSYIPVASKRSIKGVYNYQAMREYSVGSGVRPSQQMFTGLCNVLGRHEHYCCHTRLMEFYLEHKCVEVHRVYRVVDAIEHPVFHDYVEANLQKRREYASDPIKKMLYKLMNNSLYGKTYEDVTHRMSIEVVPQIDFNSLDVSDVKRVILQMANWVMYEKPMRSFTIDKPVYLGAAITEYSKLWMYRFFYDILRPVDPLCEVMYTDTDAITVRFSSCSKVRSFGTLAEAANGQAKKQIIDTSNWDDCDSLMPELREHNGEPGLFKSETGDRAIVRMVALRAKTYIMVCEKGVIKMSVKGCPMKEKGKLTYDDFYSVLMGDGTPLRRTYEAIQSKFHIVKSTNLTRIVLSADDCKRFIHPDRIHTSPLFSYEHLSALGDTEEEMADDDTQPL